MHHKNVKSEFKLENLSKYTEQLEQNFKLS